MKNKYKIGDCVAVKKLFRKNIFTAIIVGFKKTIFGYKYICKWNTFTIMPNGEERLNTVLNYLRNYQIIGVDGNNKKNHKH